MRQISMALSMYRADADEMQTESSPDPAVNEGLVDDCDTTYTWRAVILPYTKNNRQQMLQLEMTFPRSHPFNYIFLIKSIQKDLVKIQFQGP